jgi:hypothetical protein
MKFLQCLQLLALLAIIHHCAAGESEAGAAAGTNPPDTVSHVADPVQQ